MRAPLSSAGSMSPAGDWRPGNLPLPEPHLLGLGLSMILHRVRPAGIGSGRGSRTTGTILLLGGTGLAVSATRAAGATDLAVRVLPFGSHRDARIASRDRTLALAASLCPAL